jgi:phosphoglycerol geranylgeranyltransferase
MRTIYADILRAKAENRKLLAILLDPDKADTNLIGSLVSKIDRSPATHIFVGGSTVSAGMTDALVIALKEKSTLPVVLFPGNPSQISPNADGILFLSLLSGRNPDFLIGHQVQAAPILKQTSLEIIPTGYILIESGSETAVARVSKTSPMPVSQPEAILHTAQAGEMLGNKLLYLEAGSGAKNAVPLDIVSLVSKNIDIPLIVGGGIRTESAIQNAFDAGADIVVIGTAFENDLNFFDQ